MDQKLTVTIDGPGVQQGRIALRDLQRIIHPLEQAVRALLPRLPEGSARSQPDGRQSVRFLLSGIQPGSAVAEGSLAVEATIVDSMFDDDPVNRLVQGLNQGDEELPERVKRFIDRLQRNFPEGVETVEISIPGQVNKATLLPLEEEEVAAPAAEERIVTGRLMEVNFHARRGQLEVQRVRGRLTTKRIALQFIDEQASDMQRCARQLVNIKGRAWLGPDRDIHLLDVASIALHIDDRSALWPSKRFRWPSREELLTNVDMEEFLLTSSDSDEEEE